MLVSSGHDDAAAPTGRRRSGLVVVFGLQPAGAARRDGVRRKRATWWKRLTRSRAGSRWCGVLILVYGTIQDLRKWISRKRKREERAAARHEADRKTDRR